MFLLNRAGVGSDGKRRRELLVGLCIDVGFQGIRRERVLFHLLVTTHHLSLSHRKPTLSPPLLHTTLAPYTDLKIYQRDNATGEPPLKRYNLVHLHFDLRNQHWDLH